MSCCGKHVSTRQTARSLPTAPPPTTHTLQPEEGEAPAQLMHEEDDVAVTALEYSCWADVTDSGARWSCCGWSCSWACMDVCPLGHALSFAAGI